MGRLGNSPSSRGYATPTYSTTQITARETFGGPAKAGLGRHIGMGEWTFGAIVNGSSGRSGHTAPPFAGMNFPKAFYAGRLPYLHYPISKTNQLARVGVGTTGGMTRTPADGVNTEQRKAMKLRVGHWNAFWPARPIRDTPNSCCYVDPVGKMGLDNLTIFSVMLGLAAGAALALTNYDIKQWTTLDEISRNFKPAQIPSNDAGLPINAYWNASSIYISSVPASVMAEAAASFGASSPRYYIIGLSGDWSIQEFYEKFINTEPSAAVLEGARILTHDGKFMPYIQVEEADSDTGD